MLLALIFYAIVRMVLAVIVATVMVAWFVFMFIAYGIALLVVRMRGAA